MVGSTAALSSGGCSPSAALTQHVPALSTAFAKPPFELTSNPKFLYLTPQHREALSNLEYGLSSAKAVTVLIGEAGTGKTTLLKAALGSERCRNVQCVYVNNPALTRGEFVETLAERFELGPEASQSKAVLLVELESVLQERRRRGEITALRRRRGPDPQPRAARGDAAAGEHRNGQREAAAARARRSARAAPRLNDPGLRQLKQRIALRCELQPFDAGGDRDLHRQAHHDRRAARRRGCSRARRSC